MDETILYNTYKRLLENIVFNKWKFLDNEYESPITKNNEKHIKNMDIIKFQILEKLGYLPVFVFLTDYINDKNFKYNKNHLEKSLLIIFHIVTDVEHTDIQMHLGKKSYLELHKSFFQNHEETLNEWCDNMMINYFSNKNIRLISKKLNVELLQYPEFYSCTLILVTYDSRFLYNQNKYKYNTGYKSFILLDLNGFIIYTSNSILCDIEETNSDYKNKFVFDKIPFNKILSDIDCVLINTGYSFLDGYLNFQNNYINHKIKTLYYQLYTQDIFDIINANKIFKELFNIFPKLCMSRNLSNSDRIFSNRVKLCSTFYNIKKMASILDIDNKKIKYKYWTNSKSCYDDDILYNMYEKINDNKEDNNFYIDYKDINELDDLLLQQDKELENLINKVKIKN